MTETTQTHALIGKYYEEEREQREKELSLAELKLRLDANDLAMLGMIARRFRKGRDDVAQEVLSSALLDLFSCIDAAERKLMARDADDAAKSIADNIAEENGVRDVEFRTGYWTQQDRQITKVEKQREKAAKQAEKEAEKAAAQATQKEAAPTMIDAAEAQTAENQSSENKTVEDAGQYVETSAIEKAPAALETQTEAANELNEVAENSEEKEVASAE
jgi:hypothetical protein